MDIYAAICDRITAALPDGGLIGVTGNGASGKTTLIECLIKVLGSGRAGRYPFDGLYIPAPKRHLKRDEAGAVITAAHPSSVDFPLAEKVLAAIRNGLQVPIFTDDIRATAHEQTGIYSPRKYDFIDGLGACHGGLHKFYGFLIFVECSEETELARRVARDTAERHQSMEEIRRLFRMRREQYRKYVLPMRMSADIIIKSGSEGGFMAEPNKSSPLGR